MAVHPARTVPWSAPQEAGLKAVSIQMFHVLLNISITSVPASQMSCPKTVTHTASKLYLLRLKFTSSSSSHCTLTRLPTQLRRLNCQTAIPSISPCEISQSHQTPEALHGKAFLQHGLVFVGLFWTVPQYFHILPKFWESELDTNSSRSLPVLGTVINIIPSFYLAILLKHIRIPSRGSLPELISKTASAEEVSTAFPPQHNLWITV